METIVVTMIIVWAVVVGAALLAEFLMYNLISAWFAVGGMAALISAAAGLPWPWQILVFVCVSFAFLAALRPFVIKFVRTKTVPTNADEQIGKRYKLATDVVEGRGKIKIHDVFWIVDCEKDLKEGEMVEVTGISGNKYIVKEVTP